jgi:pyruvate/2-oxoglutarate dehydrogenase complex dihydrolipoamide acyltransferase (E2) component
VSRIVPVPLRVPDFGRLCSGPRVVQWLMEPGSPVSPGDRVVELLADGVLFHVSCDVSGVIVRIDRPRGSDVTPGETLAWVEPEG